MQNPAQVVQPSRETSPGRDPCSPAIGGPSHAVPTRPLQVPAAPTTGLEEHFFSTKQRTTTFKGVHFYPSSLNPTWARASTHFNQTCMHLQALFTYMPTVQGVLFPFSRPCILLLPYTMSSLLFPASLSLHRDFLSSDCHVALVESAFLDIKLFFMFCVTKKKLQALGWIINTEVFLLLQIQGSY